MKTAPSPYNLPAFMRRQYEFTAHIRDPRGQAAPVDVEERRMGIYRELFYNNIKSFLESNFPVLRKIMEDPAWEAMVQDFFARHQSQTPYFAQIPEEFLSYLQEERGEHPEDPPFLLELAHYEWVELALSIATEELAIDEAQRGGDLLAGIPVLSPLTWPLVYRFPVHRISPEYFPQEPPEQLTYLVVYRNREDKVGFLEINPVTYRLIELLQSDSPLTGRQALENIAAELNHPNPEQVIQGGLDILKNLYFFDIIVVVREAN